MAGRIAFQPFVGFSGTLLTVSSQELVFPARRLRDLAPGAVWRSKSGWNVSASFNDRLDFTEGGTARVASLAVENYETGALAAAQVQAAMNAAPGHVNTYTVTHDPATNKFTIARATGTAAVVLKFGDGANLARSVHLDLGYTSANKSGGTSWLAENVAFKSREWVKTQLTVAAAGSFACAVNHNLSASGTATLAANATDAWAAPSFTQALSDSASEPIGLRLKFFSTQTFAWWRLVLADVQNSAAFTELGMFHVSGYVEPAIDFRTPWAEDRDELTTVGYADQGATYLDEKPSRLAWPLSWPALTQGEKTNFDNWLNFVKRGKPFFFGFEPTSNPSFTRYVLLSSDGQWAKVPPDYWALSVKLQAVLA